VCPLAESQCAKPFRRKRRDGIGRLVDLIHDFSVAGYSDFLHR
jgi:hypothetical protein